MNKNDIHTNLKHLYKKWSGEEANTINQLPESGSDRIYFRLSGKTKKAIGVYNSDSKENKAFLNFSEQLFLLHT